MNGGINMPKGFGYTKKGWKNYFKKLKNKRKKKKVKISGDGYDNRDQHLWTPPGGETP